ncbi:LemA family protein [Chromobacterium haemolyticum]|uniref:LemA family protein n=1 Tax=Chromobacterium haemolyticum TaxID=394935 RepID=UPI003F61900A
MALLLAASLSGCGYNAMQTQDEAANAAWSEVINQYQRRADLIPNLVKTVQGYAKHEKEVLTQVTAARARVGSIQMDPGTATDEKKLNDFAAARLCCTNQQQVELPQSPDGFIPCGPFAACPVL